jgi:hypothetical protein
LDASQHSSGNPAKREKFPNYRILGRSRGMLAMKP